MLCVLEIDSSLQTFFLIVVIVLSVTMHSQIIWEHKRKRKTVASLTKVVPLVMNLYVKNAGRYMIMIGIDHSYTLVLLLVNINQALNNTSCTLL